MRLIAIKYLNRLTALLKCVPWLFLGPVAQNQDKGLSQDIPVILDEFSLDLVAQKQRHLSYHGDLFCAASLLLTRLTANLDWRMRERRHGPCTSPVVHLFVCF